MSNEQTALELPVGNAQRAPGALRRLRRLVGKGRHVPARVLHPLRRRAAVELLRTGPPPRSVLTICTGNIYRSPYAAVLLQALLEERGLGERIEVSSAGFVGPDRPSPDDAQARAASRGLDLSTHRSRVLTQQLVAEADLLVVMDPEHERLLRQRFTLRPEQKVVLLGDLDPQPIPTRAILDPWRGQADELVQSYDRIDRSVGKLVEALAGDRDDKVTR